MTVTQATAALAFVLGLSPVGAWAQDVPGPRAVPADRAIKLFDAICTATAKDKFAGATEAMKANGINVPSPWKTPTLYSPTEDLSFQVARQDGRLQCSMVFGSDDGDRAVVRAVVRRFGRPAPVDGQLGIRDPVSGLMMVTDGGNSDRMHTIYHIALLDQ